jgi:hypothetical protein
MKKLILLLLLIPSLAWGQVSTSGVSLSGCSSGGASAAACNPASDEVGQRTEHPGTSSFTGNYLTCELFEAECSGSLGVAYIFHHGTDTDNVKIAVFDSVYQTDLETSHLPDSSDTIVSGSQWVTISGSTETWMNSGATKVGGAVTGGKKYFICAISDSTAFQYRRITTGSLIVYQVAAGTWGSYASPPSNLDDGDTTWNAYTARDISVYVAIE